MLIIDEDLSTLFVYNERERCKIVTFVNPYSYYILKDSGYASYFDYVFSDGISLAKLSNFLCRTNINRFSFDFTSLAPISFDFFCKQKFKIAVIGGSESEIVRAHNVILDRHPDIDIAFVRNGFFSNDDFSEAISDMSALGIDVIISGMGTPKQEKFLIECKTSIPSLKYGFTCGGFLTQIAQNQNYFHPLFNRLNLRWLQRFIRHSFVRRRLLIDYPRFFLRYSYDFLVLKIERK